MKIRAALALLLATAGAAHAQAKHDTLTIGIAQFPSSLQPDIDPEVVRGYVMGFVIRQITAFDKDWHNSCLLCTQLPTLDNGLAKIEDRPDGTKGMAVTIKLKPGLKWGDGQPVTAKDIAFTWKLASDPSQRLFQLQPLEPRQQRGRGGRPDGGHAPRSRARPITTSGTRSCRSISRARWWPRTTAQAPISTAPTTTAHRSTPACMTAPT